jgi:chromosome segregation ATPase
MESPPPPSDRLVAAAVAEQASLEDHAARLTAERDEVANRLRHLERALAELSQRQSLLDHIAQGSPELAVPGNGSHAALSSTPPQRSLQGPTIRKTGVRLLLDDPRAAREGIHYRDWYARLAAAGYAVIGKDPLAVFLTQISRSPAVRKTDLPGVYRIDFGAASQLRTRIDELKRALREMATVTTNRPDDLRHVRERRTMLTAELAQAERALEEIIELLGRARTAAALMS